MVISLTLSLALRSVQTVELTFDLFLTNDSRVNFNQLTADHNEQSGLERKYSQLFDRNAALKKNYVQCDVRQSEVVDAKRQQKVNIHIVNQHSSTGESTKETINGRMVGGEKSVSTQTSVSIFFGMVLSDNFSPNSVTVQTNVSRDPSKSISETEQIVFTPVSNLSGPRIVNTNFDRMIGFSGESAVETDGYLKQKLPEFKNLVICGWGTRAEGSNVLPMPPENTVKHYRVNLKNGKCTAEFRGAFKI
jgi:hypothetical protein